MAAKISVLGLILSSYPYLRFAMVRFPLDKDSNFLASVLVYQYQLTADWLDTSPPNTRVKGLNPHRLKYDNQKRFIWRMDLSSFLFGLDLLMF